MAVSIFLATLPSPPPSFMYIQSADASEKTELLEVAKPQINISSSSSSLVSPAKGPLKEKERGERGFKKERGTVSQAREDRRQAGLSNLPRFIILFYYAGKSAAASGELFWLRDHLSQTFVTHN